MVQPVFVYVLSFVNKKVCSINTLYKVEKSALDSWGLRMYTLCHLVVVA